MDFFIFNSQFQVLICTKCQFGIPLGELSRHIRDIHRTISLQRKAEIILHFQQYPGIIRDQKDLQRFQLPPPETPAINGLSPPILDGLACTICQFVTRFRQAIQRHYRTNHNWVNANRLGRPSRAQPAVVPWRTNVPCQRLFQTRLASNWFEVTVRDTASVTPQHMLDKPDSIVQWAKTQLEEFQQPIARTIQSNSQRLEPNQWLNRTRWASHLQGLDLTLLYSLTELSVDQGNSHCIDETPIILGQVWEVFTQLVRNARQICTLQECGFAVLVEVNRTSYERKARRPFDIYLQESTWDKYMVFWKRILGTIVRMLLWSGEEGRPYFSATRQQDLHFNQLQDFIIRKGSSPYTKEDKVIVKKYLLDFIISLFNHQLELDEYSNILISSLAILGLKQSSDMQFVWHGPQDYTQIYSSIIKIVRLLIIYQSMLEYDEESPGTGLFSTVRSKVQTFGVLVSKDGLPTPMNWILETRAYGMNIRYSMSIAGKVNWQGDHIIYQDVEFSIPQLQDFIQHLNLELSRTMAELLFLNMEEELLPEVQLRTIFDDIGITTPGYFFPNDKRNSQWAQDGQTWLLQRILDSVVRKRQWIQSTSGNTIRFRTNQVTQYIGLVDDFRKKLLLLFFLTGGQPPRTTELLNIRFKNTSYGGLRNIFITDGRVCFATWYHKNLQGTDKPKLILRYLPQEASEQFVRYIWLIHPFIQLLFKTQESTSQASPFLWARQVIYTPKPEVDASYESKYQEVWNSDLLRTILIEHSKRLLMTRLTISNWRHIMVSICRKYLRDIFQNITSNQGSYEGRLDSSDSEEDQEADALTLQFGHSRSVEENIYGRSITQGPGRTEYISEGFRKASFVWHSFLGLQGEQKPDDKKRSYEAFQEQLGTARSGRFQSLQAANLRSKLRTMLGRADAEFREPQEKILHAIVRGLTPILVVCGTSTGKSLSFMLPAFICPQGTTVVIVPLQSLQEDLVERCRTMKIDAIKWTSELPFQTATIIIITAESALTKTFQDMLNKLIVRDQLDRIFIDECHSLLDSSADFRPKMKEVAATMAMKNIQLIFLTATLAVRDKGHFFQLTKIPENEFTIIQTRTTRHNIQYSVVAARSISDEEQRVSQLGAQLSQAGTIGRSIIYCQSIRRGTKLAAELGCRFYYSDAGTYSEKRDMIQEWRTKGKVIVATNALGLGLDVGDVRTVVHAGAPRRLRDYCQESGRAGRDGG